MKPPELLEGRGYRDEMNLAEFPLAALSDRLPEDQKTLTFEDTVFDRGRGEPVVRRLTISASDKYGLPTSLDDEVILGLVQLTNARGFADRKVHFTRRELIRTLGWRDHSSSYARVKESLERWLAVTLYYDKAWWSKDEQCWVSEAFHILEQVTVLDRDRRDRRMAARSSDPEAGCSSFSWNEVVFASFQAGYLKKLDMDFFRTLKSRVGRRLYRFLDKRFYRSRSLEFDLKHLAFQHIGLSKNYSCSQVKRLLRPAIDELVDRGYLVMLPNDELFTSERRGVWKVRFKRSSKAAAPAVPVHDPLVSELAARGLSKQVAAKLVREHPESSIREKVALHDWLLEVGGARAPANPPGYLYRAITEDYQPPKDFRAVRRPTPESASTRKRSSTGSVVDARRRAAEEARETGFQTFWVGLSPEQQEAFEVEAVEAADSLLRAQYLDGRGNPGPLCRAAREAILRKYWEREAKRAAA